MIVSSSRMRVFRSLSNAKGLSVKLLMVWVKESKAEKTKNSSQQVVQSGESLHPVCQKMNKDKKHSPNMKYNAIRDQHDVEHEIAVSIRFRIAGQ